MVEAAMVFPLVILTVMALISMMVFFYQQTETRARMHIALRAESGKASKTVEYLTKAEAVYPIYKKSGQMHCQGTMSFFTNGLLNEREKGLSASKYIDRETNFIRYVDLIRQKENRDGQ